jgi:hypothetical protein
MDAMNNMSVPAKYQATIPDISSRSPVTSLTELSGGNLKVELSPKT